MLISLVCWTLLLEWLGIREGTQDRELLVPAHRRRFICPRTQGSADRLSVSSKQSQFTQELIFTGQRRLMVFLGYKCKSMLHFIYLGIIGQSSHWPVHLFACLPLFDCVNETL
jgi:hypothetical protein